MYAPEIVGGLQVGRETCWEGKSMCLRGKCVSVIIIQAVTGPSTPRHPFFSVQNSGVVAQLNRHS